MTFANMARDKTRARGTTDCTDVAGRLAQHLRRLDEHRTRIEHVERTVDDTATEATQLAAVERRLVELQVAAGQADASTVREPATR